MNKGYQKSTPSKGYDSLADLPETLSLDEDDLPEVKTWKVGQKYTLTIDVKMTGLRQDSMDKTMRGSFDILNVQPEEDNADTETD